MERERRLVIVDSAKSDFKDIKAYVRREFGSAVWNTVNAEYKQAFKRIKERPELGSPLEVLAGLGMVQVRQQLVRQTRIIYEFDGKMVLIHLLIGTRRNFRAHLLQRLLSC